jgi:hypothetical protein
MVSVPHWTRGGYEFDGESRFSVRRLTRWSAAAVRWITRQPELAPPAPKSLIYALCEEYRQLDLWTAYHAFRLDPHAGNWRRLRRRNVPWQGEQTVEDLLQRMHPLHGKRTPDANAVGVALITVPTSSPKKKR